jgi:pyruvate,water dikinase
VAQNVSAVLQEYLGFYGDEAPGWDVMCKTLREDAVAWREAREARLSHQGPSPEERRRSAARGSAELARALSLALPEDERRIFADKLTYARLLYPLLEEDDLLFSKAIAYLRRAFLQEGKKLGLADGEDVFFLSAEERRAKLSPEELRSRAEEGRALWRQRALRPPLPPAPQAASGLRGEGASPGVVRGRVRVLLDFTAPRFSPGEILVVPALTPALSHILIFAAGLVAEHGGALSHAASMAREYGIPAVVGAAGATRLLHDGQHITIDGRTGAISLDEA